MSDLQENGEPPEWVVYEFPKNARIYCRTSKNQGPGLFRDISHHQARMIRMLQQAFDEDKGLPSDLRGFRHRDQLAKTYDGHSNVRLVPATMTCYLSRLVKLFKSHDPSGEPLPKLIVREKGKGARLTAPVRFHTIGGEANNR